MNRKKNKDMGQRTLGQKIGGAFASLIGYVIIIVCIESVFLSGLLATGYTMQGNLNSAEAYTAEIDMVMQSKVSMLETIAVGISSGTLSEEADIRAYVDSMVGLDEQISAVYSCYDENITFMSGGWEPPADFIVTEREWYLKAQENPDEVYISEPYVDEQTGQLCITLAKATFADGEMMGVVGMDIYMDELVKLMEESYNGQSYVFLVTSGGTVLTHPNEEFAVHGEETPNVSEVGSGRYANMVSQDMKINLFNDYRGGLKFGVTSTAETTGWKVISVTPLHELILFFIAILVINSLIYIITKQIARKRSLTTVSKLVQPLESISGKVSKITEGELTVVFDEEQNSTEMELLTNSLNDTIQGLRYYISTIAETVTSISEKNLTATVDGEFHGSYIEIKESLENILDSLNASFRQIQEESDTLLRFSDELQKTTEAVAESASQQSMSISTVTEDIIMLRDHAGQITDSAANMQKIAEVTNDHLRIGTEEMQEVVKAIDGISDCFVRIADFVGEINEIAEQTNLLSLNASIEAARAGEAGRGFAVVASEISDLAASSARASENISQLIQTSKEAVNSGKKLITETSGTIVQGMEDSQESTRHIGQIVDFVNRQKDAIENISAAMNEIAAMVENNAASAQENQAICIQLGESAQTLKNTASEFRLR
ncbi:MAG: methyl-accepting chemotaxis protein [Lachnospiraceae bacterium]